MIVAVEMGYGHLRAAHNLAELFGTEITRMDVPPIAGAIETEHGERPASFIMRSRELANCP